MAGQFRDFAAVPGLEPPAVELMAFAGRVLVGLAVAVASPNPLISTPARRILADVA
jgi:hypothetical protein